MGRQDDKDTLAAILRPRPRPQRDDEIDDAVAGADQGFPDDE